MGFRRRMPQSSECHGTVPVAICIAGWRSISRCIGFLPEQFYPTACEYGLEDITHQFNSGV
jgi:hypothetical protein